MPNTPQHSLALAGAKTPALISRLTLLTVLIASSPLALPFDASAHAQMQLPERPSKAGEPPALTYQAPRASAGLTGAQTLTKSQGMRARKRGEVAAALGLLRPIAEAGDPESQNVVGEILTDGGRDVTIDDVEAAAWFRKAAIQGFAAGQVNLGLMLEHGKGVTRDLAEASRWFRRAALEGFAEGQHNLARMYETGTGLPLDLGQAVFWYAKAVNQNFAPAQFAYGLMHRDGIGVPRNPAEAIRLFRRAASQGMVEARQALEALEEANTTSSRS
jgi:TPR repeat protein